jgi:CelD/BcsL family acetyltransferase involved in cellulose biosynthesis
MEATLPSARHMPRRKTADAAHLLERRVELITGEQDLLGLEPVWDALLAQSATRTPFLTWDWIARWHGEKRGQFQLAVGVVRDSHGAVEAIAPLMIGRPAEWQRRHMRHLLFLSDGGDIMPEGMDFIVPQGREVELAPALCQVFRRLRGQYDAVLLNAMHAESPCLPHIIAALRANCSGLTETKNEPSWMTALPSTWEAVELSHGQNWRSNHRRKWKKMLGKHQGRTLLAGRDLPVDAAFDALIELHSRRWTKDESSFLREGTMRFHRGLVNQLVPEGRAMICILELDGRPAAATYCLVHDQTAHFYQAGWNADYSAISIGKMAVAWTFQCAIERGLKTFDFLPGDFPYKREWGDSSRRVICVEAFAAASLRANAFRLLRFVKQKVLPKKAHPHPHAPQEPDAAPSAASEA